MTSTLLLGILFPGALTGVASGAGEVNLTDELGRGSKPVQTRMAVVVDEDWQVNVKVTLVFPHSGFDVMWGEPHREGNHIQVEVKIDGPHATALPVVTGKEHVYRCGRFPEGYYAFEVVSSGQRLGITRFQVSEDPRPPASAELGITVFPDRRAMARVRVLFHQAGYEVRDWGHVTRADNVFRIEAEAVQVTDAAGVEGYVLEQQQTYWLARGPLDPGKYELSFSMNGHSLAQTDFTVHEDSGLVQRIGDEPLTQAGQPTHPLYVYYWHPSGIDTSTLGDNNIRVAGPEGYERFATLDGWKPSADGTAGAIIVRYLAHAPGRYWTARDNGSYSVSLAADTVRSRSGYSFPAWRLGILQVTIPDVSFPWVRFQSLEIREESGGVVDPVGHVARLTLLVGSTNVQVDWGDVTIEGNEIWVAIKAWYEGESGLPVVTPRHHDYRLGQLAAGHYHFMVYAHERLIGEKRFAVDPEAIPRAKVVAGDITEPGPAPHVFQVHYMPDMDLDSIRQARLRVVGPEDYGKVAELVGLHTHGQSPVVTKATYLVNPPPHGWLPRQNGFYGIHLPRNTIRNIHGNHVAGGLAGGFNVMIDPVTPPGGPTVDFQVVVDDAGHATVDLAFDPGSTQWIVTHWSDHVELVGFTFVAKARIHEYGMPPYPPQTVSYELGRLKPGIHRFVLHGSNGFASRHTFRVGDGLDLLPPYKRWYETARELIAIRGGDPLPEAWEQDESLLHAYAFGQDPGQPPRTRDLGFSHELDDEGIRRLLITHPVVSEARDIVYRVEVSTDLEEWKDASGFVEVRELRAGGDGICERTVEIPIAFFEGWPGPWESLFNRGLTAVSLFTRVRADRVAAGDWRAREDE